MSLGFNAVSKETYGSPADAQAASIELANSNQVFRAGGNANLTAGLGISLPIVDIATPQLASVGPKPVV